MTAWPTVADDCVQHIAVEDGREPLVALKTDAIAGLHLDQSPHNVAHLGYPPMFLLRSSVARRLQRVPGLLPPGLQLLVKECYRPLSVQQRYFSGYLAKVQARHPLLDLAACRMLAARYVAPPECASHVTGGAVDVTLVDPQGRELDLGTPYDAAPELCANACFTDAVGLPAEALRLRRALIDAMAAAGFVNYPYEWWHWSHGDKYWAHVGGLSAALYGPAAQPPGEGSDAAISSCASNARHSSSE